MHETACTACPAGATCSGGDNRPIPAWGFWADKTCTAYGGSVECGDHWDMFFECQDPGMCIGGANFSCAKGKGGKNCLQLQPGFFEVAGVSTNEFHTQNFASTRHMSAHKLSLNVAEPASRLHPPLPPFPPPEFPPRPTPSPTPFPPPPLTLGPTSLAPPNLPASFLLIRVVNLLQSYVLV
jgi:hypothetical protein